MAFQYSDASRNAANDAIETALGASPLLRMYSGLPPANVAAAVTGTLLVDMVLPVDALSASAVTGGNADKTLLGTWQDAAADASGRAGYFRLFNATGPVAHIQGLVSDAWVTARAYSINDQVNNGGNTYRATTAGTSGATAPTHTTGTVSDGAVSWAFVQLGTDMVAQNATITAGQQVTITAFTQRMGGG